MARVASENDLTFEPLLKLKNNYGTEKGIYALIQI